MIAIWWLSFLIHSVSNPANTSYYPLIPHSYYVYRSNLGQLTITVVKDTGENNLIRIEKSPYGTSKEYLTIQPDGVYCRGREIKFFIGGTSYWYKPPKPRIKWPLIVDTCWHWYGKKLVNDTSYDAIATISVIGVDTVDVPAGRFICIKLTDELRVSDGTHSRSTIWLAPGVGVVKLEAQCAAKGILGAVQKLLHADTVSVELESYQPKH